MSILAQGETTVQPWWAKEWWVCRCRPSLLMIQWQRKGHLGTPCMFGFVLVWHHGGLLRPWTSHVLLPIGWWGL